MRNLIILVLLGTLFTACTTTQRQVDAINKKLEQTSELLIKAKEETPKLIAGLEKAHALAEKVGYEKASAEIEEWKTKIANNVDLVDKLETGINLLKEEASNIQVGDPWWLTSLKLVGGVALALAGGTPIGLKLMAAKTALAETVKAVQTFREDPSTDHSKLDAALGTVQSTKSKSVISGIKSKV